MRRTSEGPGGSGNQDSGSLLSLTRDASSIPPAPAVKAEAPTLSVHLPPAPHSSTVLPSWLHTDPVTWGSPRPLVLGLPVPLSPRKHFSSLWGAGSCPSP